jgi:hypothetical protein
VHRLRCRWIRVSERNLLYIFLVSHMLDSSLEHQLESDIRRKSDLSSLLLTLIRNRRNTRSKSLFDGQTGEESDTTGLRQREVEFSDFEQVAALKKRCGLSADSIQNWDRLWRDNPAMHRAHGPLALGWVLETRGKIVGYLGSIPLLYQHGQEELVAATASGFAVDPVYRAFCVGLVASFYHQRNIDLFLNTTAIESVGRLAKAFRAEVLPQEDYDVVLFWILNPAGFANALCKKIGVSGPMEAIGKIVGSVSLKVETALRARHPLPRKGNFQISNGPVSNISTDFEDIWQRTLEGEPRMMADRHPSRLAWHFNVPNGRHEIHVLRCEKQGRMFGYAILRMETEPRSELYRCLLADMLVEGDDPSAIESLLATAYDLARDAGCHLFEILGFPVKLRRVFQKGRPYMRRFPAPPFYFKAKNPSLHQRLRNPECWYASPFDGDTTLMP